MHLFERECSVPASPSEDRGESPSPGTTTATLDRMYGDAATSLARQIGYVGAGTVEFLVFGQGAQVFYFLEMNTRLQVEHPVTEEVTGENLVAGSFTSPAAATCRGVRRRTHLHRTRD